MTQCTEGQRKCLEKNKSVHWWRAQVKVGLFRVESASDAHHELLEVRVDGQYSSQLTGPPTAAGKQSTQAENDGSLVLLDHLQDEHNLSWSAPGLRPIPLNPVSRLPKMKRFFSSSKISGSPIWVKWACQDLIVRAFLASYLETDTEGERQRHHDQPPGDGGQ